MNRKRITRTFAMALDRGPETVFPLLCPVREREWIEPWRCGMIYTESGAAEMDCVFQTDFPQDGPRDTWVICRYEKPRLVEFVRVNALRAIRYTITLRRTGEGKTEAEWRQVVTGLSEEGDRWVEGRSGEDYARQMRGLQEMLNHYLATGGMLKASGPG